MYPLHKSAPEAYVNGRRGLGSRAVRRPFPARPQGFSLIELMVGMLISLICVLAIMAAFAVFEGKKRTTTSGDDAQQNGSYTLYELERQIRTAGSGLVQGKSYSVWGCPITTLTVAGMPAPFNNAALKLPATTQVMPVLIASGGTSPDVISVMGGNPALQVFKIGVTSAPGPATVIVGNTFGLLTGDYLLGTMTDGSCAIGQIAPTTPTELVTNISTTNITLSAAAGKVTGLANAVNVFDLGQQPVFSLFGVDPTINSLVEFDQLQRTVNGGPTPIPIADGIVQLKALYGIHDGTGVPNEASYAVDKWVAPTGDWAISALTANTAAAQAAIAQIAAIRIAVVSQSRLPERASDNLGGATSLMLFPDLTSSGLNTSVATQTQYRYKVYDTTIPIRNAFITNFF
jgi:type IV pilus assembly protein PilW